MAIIRIVIGLSVLPLLLDVGFANPAMSTKTKFDLICERTEVGMESDGLYNKSSGSTTDYSVIRLSINLNELTWCYQPCRKVGNVAANSLELKLSDGPHGIGPQYALLNRNSGIMVVGTRINQSVNLISTYNCKKTVFSSIPTQKF